jgi:hypothetical protein
MLILDIMSTRVGSRTTISCYSTTIRYRQQELPTVSALSELLDAAATNHPQSLPVAIGVESTATQAFAEINSRSNKSNDKLS